MQCFVKYEIYQLKKSQSILFPIISSRTVKKTGIVTVFVICVVISQFLWLLLFPGGPKSITYYFVKVSHIILHRPYLLFASFFISWSPLQYSSCKFKYTGHFTEIENLNLVKFVDSGFVLGSSQALILPHLPQKNNT